jgi:histidine ammonia-lyase
VKFELLVAIELVAAAQAVDLAKLERLAPRLAQVHAALRARSRFIDDDRPLGREIEKITAELVAIGALRELAGCSPKTRRTST